jgi:hypothetical protein
MRVEKIKFSERGGGGINIVLGSKYKPLLAPRDLKLETPPSLREMEGCEI